MFWDIAVATIEESSGYMVPKHVGLSDFFIVNYCKYVGLEAC